jgi:hypothetical protein
MKTSGRTHFFAMALGRAQILLLFLIATSLSSCMKGDEELQRQLIELRTAVDTKTKAAEQLEAQVADLQNRSQHPAAAPSVASSEELVKAKARITELEQRLAAASANPGAPAPMGKIDMDEIAGKLEDDLTRKAKQLRELLQRQSPSSRIDEISLKSIEYPPQLVTPFNSAITFTVSEGTGTPMRLMFPVTADLSGSWKLPTPDEIQKAYKAALEQPQGAVASTPQAGQPANQGSPQAQPQATSSGGGGARMTQRGDGVFVFDWGDAPSGGQPRQPAQNTAQPRPAATGGPQTVNNFVPPGSQPGGAPQPEAQPRAPAAAPQAPSVPAPVMPVVGDRVIRFND